MPQLTNESRIARVLNATVGGTSTPINSNVVDTQDAWGVRFIVAMGAIAATAVTTIKVQEGNSSSGPTNLADAADLAGSHLSPVAGGADDNSAFIIDVYKPLKRYLRAVVTRGTANAAIDSIVAELYEVRTLPEAADASVHGQLLLVSPAEGTA
jgi:hypothetical protein